MKGLRAFCTRVDQATSFVTAVTAGGFFLVIIGGVVGRLLGHPFSASEEWASLLFVWAMFAGAALCYRRAQHVRLTFLRDRLPPRWQERTDRAAHAVACLFLLLVTVKGAEVAWVLAPTHLPLSGLSQFWRYAPVSLFCGVMTIFAAEGALAPLPLLREGDAPIGTRGRAT